MKVPSISLLRIFSPAWRSPGTLWTARGCLLKPNQQTANFSSTEPRLKKKTGPVKDKKISMIRYFLQHPRNPRPLRFGRLRALRHWTIHRAWRLYQNKLRIQRQLQLERQYNSMNAACEALWHVDSEGMTAEDRSRIGEGSGEGREVGRLYRIAMLKDDVWNKVPIEYARIQTDTPAREPWNHDWKR